MDYFGDRRAAFEVETETRTADHHRIGFQGLATHLRDLSRVALTTADWFRDGKETETGWLAMAALPQSDQRLGGVGARHFGRARPLVFIGHGAHSSLLAMLAQRLGIAKHIRIADNPALR